MKEELQAAKDKLHLEVQAGTPRGKIWAAKSVIQAKIKMVKEAVNAGFEKVELNVVNWERTPANLGDDDEESVAANVGKAGKSKD